MLAPPATFFTPADSARVVGDMYSASLVATLPVFAAVIAFVFLRQSSAGTRAVVWRCTVAGLLAIYAGRFVPWQWMAWVLPELLARPLVTLGTVQLDVPPGVHRSGDAIRQVPGAIGAIVFLYWSGVGLVLIRTVIARLMLVGTRRRALTLTAPLWRRRLREASDATGVSIRTVRLLASPEVPVPVTWGVRRHVILLPHSASHWTADRLQAVLRHELAHVLARDAAMRLATRIACALFWFHPGVWWLARRLEADAEAACDDRVLLSGVRASDYAECLAASTPARDAQLQAAMALSRPGNLRTRLATITDTRRHVAVPGRRLVFSAVTLTAVIVAPLATTRLAPTREVLTSLMQEARWESRAWAVVRLAQRADSVDVARTAARHDPDPAVRAWARYALARGQAAPAPRPGS
jgi:beta-lactamase regulating signal transducer with metallopeptidase domain